MVVFSAKLYTLRGFSSKHFALKNHRQVAPAACLLGCAHLHGCNLQECSFPAKCSIEMFLCRELQRVMLCLVIISEDRHFPAPSSWVVVQVNSSQTMCLGFRLLF